MRLRHEGQFLSARVTVALPGTSRGAGRQFSPPGSPWVQVRGRLSPPSPGVASPSLSPGSWTRPAAEPAPLRPSSPGTGTPSGPRLMKGGAQGSSRTARYPGLPPPARPGAQTQPSSQPGGERGELHTAGAPRAAARHPWSPQPRTELSHWLLVTSPPPPPGGRRGRRCGSRYPSACAAPLALDLEGCGPGSCISVRGVSGWWERSCD